jgi:hypothetical protein
MPVTRAPEAPAQTEAGRQTDRQTGRQAGGQAGRRAGRQRTLALSPGRSAAAQDLAGNLDIGGYLLRAITHSHLNDAPCAPCASHGASIRRPLRLTYQPGARDHREQRAGSDHLDGRRGSWGSWVAEGWHHPALAVGDEARVDDGDLVHQPARHSLTINQSINQHRSASTSRTLKKTKARGGICPKRDRWPGE